VIGSADIKGPSGMDMMMTSLWIPVHCAMEASTFEWMKEEAP